MRIAISGSHGTGKSTLVEALSSTLSGYCVVGEPFYELLEQGHIFAAPPSFEDFEVQLEYAVRQVLEVSGPDCLFDRCPADFLAYLASATGQSDPTQLQTYFNEVAGVMSRLDLVVFVPIERPDRIQVGSEEGPRLRRRTDHALREILVEDAWGWSCDVLEVRGDVQMRTKQVLSRVGHLDL